MIYASILLKAWAFLLAGWSMPAAVLCWLAGLAADVFRYRNQPRPLLIKAVLLLNTAAWVAGRAALLAGDYAAMRWKGGIPGCSHLTDLVLTTLKLPAGVHAGEVYLSSMAGPLRFSASLDNLGFTMVLVLFALSAVYLLWDAPGLRQAGRRLAAVAGILAGIALLRFILFLLLFLGLCDFVSYESEELPISPFIRTGAVMWMFLPLLLLVIPLMNRVLAPATADPPASPSGMNLLRWCVPAVLVLCLLGLWEPRGTAKQGEVLINTFHTQWSRTDRPYDRDWYGADSGYNYACLKRLFETFYPVRELKSRITAADLEKASVLIIYIPDKAFTDDEIRLVREFVRGGGGVLLIGDHTNVFGSTSHLNSICKPFGFFFRDDVLFDIDEDFHQLRDLEGMQPGVLHGMDFFKFRGPASIQPTSLGTRSILDIGHAKSVRAIYSVNNFYPPPHDHPQMMTGKFCAAAVSRYGRGRVAAFADSTVFSNFEIFYPGKYEYLVNHVHWLNHRDSAPGNLLRRLCSLAVLIGLAVVLFRVRDPRSWLFLITASLLALGISRRASLLADHARTDFPPPVKSANALFFVADTHDPGYALRDFASQGDYNRRYDVFIQWVLRTGAFSGFYMTGLDRTRGLYEHYRDSKPVQAALGLILRSEDDLGRLDTLKRIPGVDTAPVLLMVSEALSADQVTAELLKTGLISPPEQEAARAAWPNGEAMIQTRGGRLFIVTASERFSDQNMGFSEKVVPDETQRALYDRAFALIDRLFGIEPVSQPPASQPPASQPPVPQAPAPQAPNPDPLPSTP